MSKVWEIDDPDAYCGCSAPATLVMTQSYDRIKYLCRDCFLETRLQLIIDINRELDRQEELESWEDFTLASITE